ncbi:hypothetical protein MKW98_029399, partial [Papaver atlanticum]
MSIHSEVLPAADSSSSQMPPKSSKKPVAEFMDNFKKKRITLSVPVGFSSTVALDYDWLTKEDWSANKIIVSLGKLQDGLPIPLYDP